VEINLFDIKSTPRVAYKTAQDVQVEISRNKFIWH